MGVEEFVRCRRSGCVANSTTTPHLVLRLRMQLRFTSTVHLRDVDRDDFTSFFQRIILQ